MPDLTPPTDPPPHQNPPPRTAFEWSLSALRPTDADVARPSFMYKAGQASRESTVRLWRWVAAACALATFAAVAVAFAAVMLAISTRQQVPPQEQRVVFDVLLGSGYGVDVQDEPLLRPAVQHPLEVTRPTDPTPAEIVAALARRRQVLVGGLGLIPTPPPPAPALDRPLTPNTGVFAAPR